jgi:hypothetical protein
MRAIRDHYSKRRVVEASMHLLDQLISNDHINSLDINQLNATRIDVYGREKSHSLDCFIMRYSPSTINATTRSSVARQLVRDLQKLCTDSSKCAETAHLLRNMSNLLYNFDDGWWNYF